MEILTFGLAILAGLMLSFWNGANDNFKGVATLLGSNTTTYKKALIWATVTTVAGSLTAFFLAHQLLTNFSGKGLVPDEVLQLRTFGISVSFAAAFTVFLATKLGFPISTTHAIVGALVGTRFLASPHGVNAGKLISTFFLPLLSSPFLAALGVIVVYPVLSFVKRRAGVKRESCLCIGSEIIELAPAGVSSGAFTGSLKVDCGPSVKIGTTVTCEERYVGDFVGIRAKVLLDSAHFLSSGMVCFARGLNDTPKIAAILLAGGAVLGKGSSIWMVAGSMALGGWFFSNKLAQTMSFKITTMNDGQGFSSNFITSIIVILASRFGLPVSTTHVSCGSLFGLGTVTGSADWRSISKIISSWLITLPVAAVLGYIIFYVLQVTSSFN